MTDAGAVLVVGAGPGFGAAVAHRFANAEMPVAVSTRTQATVDGLAGEINASGGNARAYAADATDEDAVENLFDRVEKDLGPIDVAVYNAGAFSRSPVVETSAQEFMDCWRIGCFGGFLVGREAARRMLARNRGTIILTGATAALRGSANFVNLAVGKFGLRALAQSMARELGPEGIHVAHVIIDGVIAAEHRDQTSTTADDVLSAEAIAQTYFEIHSQHRSAWTLEVDLRPYVERF
ncbi:MAG: short-chain dehydrogenase [Alphaproteobacteria bacterium]|nr:short-chain dehydrogenase [Alphaproteobacteria bacterium]|tara:strand:+ start:15763 stop:16473 length:711 start_codon:yes stop_codon:yes gene_type:complete